MPIIHYVPDDKHEPQSEIGRQAIGRQAIVYHLIRGVFMRAGVPLDELKQQTDQTFIRLHNDVQQWLTRTGEIGGQHND